MLSDWERYDIVEPLFGWRRLDGTRRFRALSAWVPKKNGKSTLVAALNLVLLVADGEPSPEVYGVAADRDQAGIIYREMASMVRKSPAMSKVLKVVDSQKLILKRSGDGFYKALSAEAPTKEGLNASTIAFDELHAQRKSTLYDTLKFSGAARTQPLLMEISTAGFDRQSIGYRRYEYAKSILDGSNDDLKTLAVIYEADIEDDHSDPKVWYRANPSLGVTIKETEFREAYEEAAKSVSAFNTFLRYRLNVWTQQKVSWLNIAEWDSCEGSYSADDLLGLKCYAGIDLASTRDLTAVVLLFPPQGSFEKYRVLPFFWAPEEAISIRAEQERQSYSGWLSDGYITGTPGRTTDYGVILERLLELSEDYDIIEVPYDPHEATQLSNALRAAGVMAIEFRQTMANMNEPTKALESLILDRGIEHNGHPVLRWNIGNTALRTDAGGRVKPEKPDHESNLKVDGTVALVTALARALTAEEGGELYTAERGLLSV